MRFVTIGGIALLAASTAALAQVTGTPTEQKVPGANNASDQKTDMPAGDNWTGSNGAMSSNAPDMMPPANDMTPASPSTPRPKPSRPPR